MKVKILAAIIFAGVVWLLPGCQVPKIASLREAGTVEASPGQTVATTKIQIRDGRFVPDKIAVHKGDTVTFTNADSTSHVVASDPYPDDSDLPDLFSPPIYRNSSYRYTFSEWGFWGVHLEENPSVLAKIVVK